MAQGPGGVDADAPDRAELLADDGGDPRRERGFHDARGEEVDVGVDGAGGGDQALAGDDGGAGADDDVDAVEGVGVAGAADRGDAALADADAGLADALDGVDHQDVGDDQVAGVADGGGLEVQSVAGGLAEAGEELVAGVLGVGLDADDESGVAEPDPVARARAVHRDVVMRVDGAARCGHAGTAVAAPRLEVTAVMPALRRFCLVLGEVAGGAGLGQGGLAGAGSVQRAVDQPGEADGDPGAADRQQVRPRRSRPGRSARVEPAGTASRIP